MAYKGDRYQFCRSRKCGKRTKWVRCTGCNGRGSTAMSTCSLRCDGGYVCENGRGDRYH